MNQIIIAFAGRKQSGKTTSAEFVREIFDSTTAKIYNFADPLKDLCMNILGLEYNQCYGSDQDKNELVNCYWNDHQLTAREVLQIVGTEMFRTMQKNVWSDATIRLIKKEQYKYGIIADCRFPNEVDAIKNAGGLVIKLNRNLYHSSHASEVALDENEYDQNNFDLVIHNNHMTISEQNTIIRSFLLSKGVLPL